MRRLFTFLFLLTCAAPAAAQIGTPTCVTEAGNLYGEATGTETTSFASATTTGDAIVIFIQANDNGRTVTSVTDNASNTYEAAVFRAGDAGIAAIWWCDNCTSAQDITATIDGTSDGTDRQTICTFSGGAADMTPTTGSHDNDSPAAATTNHFSNTAGPFLSAGSGGSIFMAANTCTSGTFQADNIPAGQYTQIATGANHMVSYHIVTTPTTEQAVTTSSASEFCVSVIASFDAAVAAGTGALLLLGVGQ